MRLSLKKLVFLVAILVISAILSISLSQQPSPPVVNGSDLVLLLNETFEVEKNDLSFFEVELEPSVTVVGYFEESSDACVNFYVVNETSFPRMLANYNFSTYVSAIRAKEHNFTFVTDHRGTYCFVFDNERLIEGGVCYDKNIMFKLYRK